MVKLCIVPIFQALLELVDDAEMAAKQGVFYLSGIP